MATEKNMSLPETKQSNPMISKLVFFGAIFSCLAMNLITVLYQFGMFTSWYVLPSPSSGVTHLLEADFAQVWIESGDGTVLTAPLWFGCENFCIEWKSVNDVPGQAERASSVTKKGEDCRTLHAGIFPFNPGGSIEECIYTSYLISDIKHYGYFALGTNGEIYYWHIASNSVKRYQLFWFSTFVFPVITASLMLLLYAMVSIVKKIRLKVQNAA